MDRAPVSDKEPCQCFDVVLPNKRQDVFSFRAFYGEFLYLAKGDIMKDQHVAIGRNDMQEQYSHPPTIELARMPPIFYKYIVYMYIYT